MSRAAIASKLANAGARLILAPDWKPIVWTEARAQEGPGLGTEDDRVVPHPRHPAVSTKK